MGQIILCTFCSIVYPFTKIVWLMSSKHDKLSFEIERVINLFVKKSLKMNKGSEAPIVRQSTKSLQKFKSFPMEDRIQLLSSEILGKSKVTPNTKPSRPSVTKSTKPTQEDMMKKIASLENQLKKKIGEDGILRNFFKTMNSSKISHIDIYLQLRKIEGIIEPLQQRLQEQNEKAQEYLEQVKRLEEIAAEREICHTKDIILLQNQIADMEETHKRQINAMEAQMETIQVELEATQLLVAELKKKNDFLQQDNKKLNKLHQQYQKQAQKLRIKQQDYSQNINELNEKIQKIARQLKTQCQKNAELTIQNESLYASKAFYQNIKQLYEQSQEKIRQLSQVYQEIKMKQADIEDFKAYCQQKDQIMRTQQLKFADLEQAYEQSSKQHKEQQDKAQQTITQLEERVKYLQQELKINQKAKLDADNERKFLKDQLQKQQLKHQEEKYLLLANQNKVRFQQDDMMSVVKKYQSQKEGQQKIVERLENKVIELTHKNEVLNKKHKELQKQLDYLKSCEKLNQKVYYENYKASGRILEINKQMAQVLKVQLDNTNHKQEESSESLDMATSSLANISSKIICQIKRLSQMIETGNKKAEIRYKEVINIFNYLKKTTSLENIEISIDKYIKLLQTGMEDMTQQSSSEESSQVYYSLIQRFKNAENAKKNIIEDSLNTVRDSLQSLKEIRKLEEFNKENLDFNQQSRPSIEQPQKYSSQFQKKYDHPRQINPNSNPFRKPTTNNRDEIQRKYFRG